ncbi:hypothetical protein EDC01DRAFT_680078 [Geopyxis carbonaria]|nr:hypothetical protein EDC01DRAFT_680078 [Geopyxis carbonaria]
MASTNASMAAAFGNPSNILGDMNDNNCTHLLGWIYNAAAPNCAFFPQQSETCLIDGVNDVYGLGIRIGLYLQWGSTVLTFLFHPETFPPLLVTNCIFSIAVSIAYLVIRHAVFAHEVYIVAMLLMMTLMMVPMELVEFVLLYRAKSDAKAPPPAATTPPVHARGPLAWLKKHLETIGDISWIIATGFLLGIVGWQFSRGPDAAEQCPCCRPKLLGTRYMEQPYAGLLYASYALLALVALLSIVLFAWLRMPKQKNKAAERPRLKDHHWSVRLGVASFFGAIMSFSVAYIETAVYQNRIQKVGAVKDAGQIIPLVVGVSSFSFTIYEVLKVCWHMAEDREEASGKEAKGEVASEDGARPASREISPVRERDVVVAS